MYFGVLIIISKPFLDSQPCYELVFNTNEYSLGSYGGIVTPEVKYAANIICHWILQRGKMFLIQDIARREAEERARLEKAERAKRERRCPTCEMKVITMVMTMVMMTMVVTMVMTMVMFLIDDTMISS